MNWICLTGGNGIALTGLTGSRALASRVLLRLFRIILTSRGVKNCVLFSEELESYLGAGFLIANGVRPVIRR